MPDAPETQKCPRRAEAPMAPGADETAPDHWRPGAEAWDYFPWHWNPRTCSFCGSLHPDDAMRLLREGWAEEKATGKDYKAYLSPPADTEALRRGLTRGGPDKPLSAPLPKLYVHHLSKEQILELNAIHRGGPA